MNTIKYFELLAISVGFDDVASKTTLPTSLTTCAHQVSYQQSYAIFFSSGFTLLCLSYISLLLEALLYCKWIFPQDSRYRLFNLHSTSEEFYLISIVSLCIGISASLATSPIQAYISHNNWAESGSKSTIKAAADGAEVHQTQTNLKLTSGLNQLK